MPATPDARRLSEALRELYAPCAPGGFQLRLLNVVQRLVPGLHHTWDEFRRPGDPPSLHSLDDLWSVMPMAEFFAIYAATIGTNPIVRHLGASPRPGVYSPTDYTNRAGWERTDFSQLLLKPFGIRHQLSAQVRTDFVFGGLVINSDRPITSDQRALVELLLPHLQQARDLSQRLAAAELEQTHGGRLALSATLACDTAGHFAPIQCWINKILREFFPVPRGWQTSATPPETVVRWAREQLVRFAQPSLVTDPVCDLIARSPGGVLRLSLHPDLRRRWQTVSLHLLRPPAAPSPATLAPRLGLTLRECEVLHWIAEGKRNAEIATILGTATGTVRKQVASILEKLGVETRGAAAAYTRAARERPPR